MGHFASVCRSDSNPAPRSKEHALALVTRDEGHDSDSSETKYTFCIPDNGYNYITNRKYKNQNGRRFWCYVQHYS